MTQIMSKNQAIQKAAREKISLNKQTVITSGGESFELGRLPMGPIGVPGLAQVNGYVLEEVKEELRGLNGKRTFKRMSYDPTIAAANNIIDIMIGKVQWNVKVPEDAPEASQRHADFIKWSMHNMNDMTWKDFISEVGSYRTYGFSLFEKNYTQVTEGEYAGRLKWKNIAPRSQETLTKWAFSEDTRELIGVWQDISQVNSNFNLSTIASPRARAQNRIGIPRGKFVLFRFNPKRNNPEGTSPLMGCYKPWKYKSLIEEYEAVGIAKDMGGIPKVGIDVEYLAKASADPNSQEAKVVAQFKKDAANLHAGEQQYVIEPIAYDESGNKLFSFELIGIQGSGKQYNTDDIIKRKQGEILMAYLADVLRLGNDSHGSFSLADSKTALLSHAIEYHLQIIADTINNDLFPSLLRRNGIDLPKEEMPYLDFDDLESVDLDEFSKFIQRLGAAGLAPKDKDFLNEIFQKADIEYRVEMDNEELQAILTPEVSRSGDGMDEGMGGGTGNSNGDDTSVSNNDNA